MSNFYRPSPSQPPSRILLFLTSLALLFLVWYGIHLIALQVSDHRLQRPYGCELQDITCVAIARSQTVRKVWLAYLLLAPMVSALLTHQVLYKARKQTKKRSS